MKSCHSFFQVIAVALCVAATAVICSCSEAIDDLEELFGTRSAVELSLTVNETTEGITRAGTSLNDTQFRLTDTDTDNRIGLRVSDSDYAYQLKEEEGSSDGLTLTVEAPDTPPYFPIGKATVDVYGWYPYAAGEAETFRIQTDQSSDDGYCRSDLMTTGKVTAQRTKNTTTGEWTVTPTPLAFTHQMAKVIVEATASTDIAEVNSISLGNVLPTIRLDKEKGTYTVEAETSDNPKVSISLAQQTATDADGKGFLSGAAVIPSQGIVGNFITITATAEGESTPRSVSYYFSTAKQFAANQVYKAVITLSAEDLKTAAISINAWAQADASTQVDIQPTKVKTGFVSFAVGDIAETYTYDGTEHKPEPTVQLKDNEGNVTGTLTKGTDYQYTYLNNVDAGTAICTIEGIGDYSGSINKTFTINARTLDWAQIGDIAAVTFSGAEHKPTPTVTDEKGITTDDYTYSYESNINAGTAKVIVTGKRNYTGSKEKTFTINRKDITNNSNITIANIANQTYTGSALTPSLTVTDADRSQTLTAGSSNDYTVVYANNTSVGTATATIMGAGNYTGTKSKTFSIVAKNSSNYSITVQNASVTYTGSTLTPGTITVKDGTTTLTKDTDYTFDSDTQNSGTNVGTYTIKVTFKGNYSGSATKTWSIAKAAPTVTAPTAKSGLTYTGSALSLLNAGSTSHGTVKYCLTNSSTESDWKTSVDDATVKKTDAGTYTIYWKVTGDANHSDKAAASISVTISKATPTVTAPTAKSLTYNKSAQTLISAGSTTGGTLQYSTTSGSGFSTSLPTGTNAGTYTVYYKVVGNSNYNDVAQKSVSVTISKATGYITLSASTLSIYNALSASTITVNSSHGGTLSVTPTSNSNTYINATISGTTVSITPKCVVSTIQTVTVSCAATTNYTAASTTCSVTVLSSIGKILGANGKVYSTISAATSAGTTASGMVAVESTTALSSSYKRIAIRCDANYVKNSSAGTSNNATFSTIRPSGASEWTLPTSNSEIKLILKSLTGTETPTDDELNAYFRNVGLSNWDMEEIVWKATTKRSDGDWYVYPYGYDPWGQKYVEGTYDAEDEKIYYLWFFYF